jgi:hypothetical protein
VSPSNDCPICHAPLDEPATHGLLRRCTACSTTTGAHMFRFQQMDFADDGDVCSACLEGVEPPREGLHCARTVAGIEPPGFPVDSEPPYLDAAPAWMGNAHSVLAHTDGWAGLEASLTGLVRGLSRALPGGVVAHVALFDGLDDATNRPAQLLAVFVVTSDVLPTPYEDAIDGAMKGMALQPQGTQALAPASPVPIVMARSGVSWRTWVDIEGAPTACFLEAGGGVVAWTGTRSFNRAQEVGAVADADVRVENY